ncbi:unnamed protein product [Hyaloperonospora brassicae]|uniref:Uncharacterized protein n=1 Tax=Hyaloperonospora brassicae TaxID=162125 RepID=A0AAV0V1V8_HYABA|nr:unnamed protein product [Hyaloperonospora brassicae]
MGTDHHFTVEEEFSKLELVLNQAAGDTAVCLRLLKKQLSDYDHRNGNIFAHSALSYLRSDMRSAKDTAMHLKNVAHQISHSLKPSKAELIAARHAMNSTTRVMEALTATARNYDKENGQSKGIKGTIDAVLGGRHDKDKHEKHSLFGKETGAAHGKNMAPEGGLFGAKREGDTTHGVLPGEKDEHHRGFAAAAADKNGGGIMGTTDTVEVLVKKNLRDNFNLSALDHQISTAEKVLSPSIVERAKEVIHDVKDKLTGDKTSPTHVDHVHGSRHATHPSAVHSTAM